MIISVAGTIDNVGVTTLSLEMARAISKRIAPKSGSIEASYVLLVEADPAGGTLYNYMKHTTPSQKASLQNMLQSPRDRLDEWLENYTWVDRNSKKLLRCLFSDARSAIAAKSLSQDERGLANYLKEYESIISVIDAGRVLSSRELVQNADVQVWVLDDKHPACLERAREMLRGVSLAGEKRIGVLVGELRSMPGKISEAIGLPLMPDPVLPHPQTEIIGDKPCKEYREAVDRLTDYVLLKSDRTEEAQT